MTTMGRQTRARRGDRGATLVELSIVALVVFVTILALIEFGLVFRDNLTATDAVADATRIGGVVGPGVGSNGGNADYEIVRSVREGLAAMNDSDIEHVVVFRASGGSQSADEQLPDACKEGTALTGICNVYPTAAAFAAVEAANTAYFDCPASDVGPACAWDPADRSDGTDGSPIDNLGVYVRIERDAVTGLFADSFTITRAQTTRLEPGNLG